MAQKDYFMLFEWVKPPKGWRVFCVSLTYRRTRDTERMDQRRLNERIYRAEEYGVGSGGGVDPKGGGIKKFKSL